jgi:predicted GIY-YIG superfamily endonuclease
VPMFAVYVIQNDVTKELYVGWTKDLKARLAQHNAHGRKFTTRENGSWQYVYIELYRSANDARVRERKLKSHGSGKHELFKRLQDSLL